MASTTRNKKRQSKSNEHPMILTLKRMNEKY
jgi:hypothetical protein